MSFLFRRFLNSRSAIFLFNPQKMIQKTRFRPFAPINEKYETIDFIPQAKQVSQPIYPKRFDFKISDINKNIPFRERYETIDF